jgi:hypothetical protein
MAHLDMPVLIEKLVQDLPLTVIEREFLRQVCLRMFSTDQLDHLTNPPKTH